jgi:hypothetical protein
MDLTKLSIESSGYFKWIFYFQVMLFGIWLLPLYKGWKSEAKGLSRNETIGFLFSLLGYITLKILFARGFGLPYQFLVQWSIFPIVFYALKCVQHPFFNLKPNAAKVISLLSSIAFEIYLLQSSIYLSPYIIALAFPFNILVFWLALIVASYAVHLLSEKCGAIIRMFMKKDTAV